MAAKRIGILGAMPEEINGIVSLLKGRSEVIKGMRTYYIGTINDIEVVVVFSRWGKVASATTVTHLIVEFGITELIFTGVAGAISKDLNIGDIVIANSLVQHDLDARPIMKQFEIPLLGKTILYPSEKLFNIVVSSTNELIKNDGLANLFSLSECHAFSLFNQKVVVGQIASGDQFISSSIEKEKLLKVIPNVLCVEMEGAAVAQVCYEYNIPFVIIRTISDSANENSIIDFKEFTAKIASKLGVIIVQKLVNNLKNDFYH
ncbi:5'-methylthioadenosine/adenosylhomocysteine nucleosidase [Flavobacterium sp.]|uniref:5'-methylthioadenosine/adenosylhomocysteine nucleosidase n=1 Tax=Flavobacterium sp. TaxID=239 RepID=UPI002C163C7B|nr:5'-methylthioadenosine/adenosylhomocysteine nucleosidase [Flavobacterium sp.]HSD05813.1 5'-methylthioadenosine/adenosylhomocysteine nucleosidase [Flavobacterium sp.]